MQRGLGMAAVIGLLTTGWWLTAAVQAPVQNRVEDERFFRRLETELMAAVQSRDAAKFADLIDREYRTVNEDGSAMDGPETLAEMRGPNPLRMDALLPPQVSEFLVRRIGNTAFVTARTAFVVDGKQVGDLRYLEVWVNRDGKWKFAHWQATRVTPQGLQREAAAKQELAKAQ